MDWVRILLRWWAAFALVAALSMLGVAHTFEHFGYPPCHLCLKQRELYWVAAGFGALGVLYALITRSRGTARLCAYLLFGVFAGEAILALFHAGVELKWWKGPASCTGTPGGAVIDVAALNALFKGGLARTPMCDVAVWKLAGVSMAGWNAMAAALLALVSLAAAARKPEPLRDR